MVSGEENFDYEKLNLLDHVFDNFHKVNCLTPLKIFMFESYFSGDFSASHFEVRESQDSPGFMENIQIRRKQKEKKEGFRPPGKTGKNQSNIKQKFAFANPRN